MTEVQLCTGSLGPMVATMGWVLCLFLKKVEVPFLLDNFKKIDR